MRETRQGPALGRHAVPGTPLAEQPCGARARARPRVRTQVLCDRSGGWPQVGFNIAGPALNQLANIVDKRERGSNAGKIFGKKRPGK